MTADSSVIIYFICFVFNFILSCHLHAQQAGT